MQELITRARVIPLRNGVGGIFIGIALLASPGSTAQAQPNGQVGRAAWCVDLGSLGGYLECNYNTYEQCAVAARGVTNVCVVNSFYVPQKRTRPSRNPQR